MSLVPGVILCRAKQEVEIMYALGFAKYMLNGVLHNPGVYIKGYSVYTPYVYWNTGRIRMLLWIADW